MTQEEPGKFHQQENGKIIETVEVKVLQGDHKRPFQEKLRHSKAKKVDEEQESHENSINENEIIINEFLENLMEEVVNNKHEDLKQKRCRKCFIDHFPYHKFCRWENTRIKKRNNNSNVICLINDDLVRKIDDKICSLESAKQISEKMSKHHMSLCDSFLQKSCNSSNLPDLCFQTVNSNLYPENRFKLKGGSRLKIFDTEIKELTTVLAILRSMTTFNQFPEHKKCKVQSGHKSNSLCSFCLVRSIVTKSRIYQGRQRIKPVELLCGLSINIELRPTVDSVNSFFEKMIESLPIFQDSIVTKWNCFSCKEDQTLTKHFCIALDGKSDSRNIDDL